MVGECGIVFNRNTTVLVRAAEGGDVEVIQLVKAAGATEGAADALAWAGSEAAFNAIHHMCTALLADPVESYRILLSAVKSQCWENVQRLLSLGVSPACPPSFSFPTLETPSSGESADNDAAVMAQTSSALLYAVLDADCPAQLLAQILGHDAIKAQVAARAVPAPPLYGSGSLPHHVLLRQCGSAQALEALLAAGFDPTDASPFTGTTACHAFALSKPEFAALLATASPAVLHIKDADDATPLHRLTGGGWAGEPRFPKGVKRSEWADEGSTLRATFALFLKLGADGELEDANGRKAKMPLFGEEEESQ